MKIKDIYEAFDKIGCLTFSTITEDLNVESRIAHLRAYDDEGLYFMTMFTKDFYKHLKNNSKIAICGLAANSKVIHDENGFPIFDRGYQIRLSGKVKEVSYTELREKNNPIFDFCLKDHEKYQAMRVFCITEAYGEIFDYDFEKETRDNKIKRIYFSYNTKPKIKGLTIDNTKCIFCKKCLRKCSFLAIKEINNQLIIDNSLCDECGDCYINCPVQAITY